MAASRAWRPISIARVAAGRRDRRPWHPRVVVGLGEDVGLVPAKRLGRVHRRVRVTNQRLHAELLSDAADDADRDRDRELGIAVHGKRLALDERSELLAEDRALLDVRLGEDQHEFFAAIAADDVAGAQMAREDLGDAPEHLVTAFVPVVVVDQLEMVDVDERDAQRAVVP